MKKSVLVVFLLICGTLFTSEVMAQQNRAGVFFAFTGGDIDATGIGGVAEFKVAEKVTIAPQLIFYFPDDRGAVDVNLLEVNVNANYYFLDHDVFELYGLGGLNFSRVKVDFDGGGDNSETEIGLNLGIGSNFQIGKSFVPFAELRLTLGEWDQSMLGLGVKFNLN